MRTNGGVVVAAVLSFIVAGCGFGFGVGVGGVAGVLSRGELVSVTAEESPSSLSPLARLNFLVGVAQLGVQQENATRCGRELELLLKAVARKEFWSLKVLDSFGTPPKSFSWGNLHWFASQRQCNDLNSPYAVAFSPAYLRTYRINPFNITSPFHLRLTMVYMRFATPHYINLRLPYESFIHIGLCLPQSCSVSALQHYTDEYFRRGGFVMQRDFEMQMQSVAARAPSFSFDFFKQTGTIISITIITTLLLLVCLAEIVHRSKEKLKLQQLLHTKAPNVAPTNGSGGCKHTANITLEPTNERTCTTKSSTLEELLLCFRLVENCRRALQPERANSNSNFLSVIAGVRTIICLWVSTFHVYYYSVFALSNAPMMFAVLANFLNQPLLQAVVFVDVFFIMSALLLVYNFLSAEARLKTIRQNGFMQNIKLFGRLVLHRYLRLTPLLIVTMLLSDMFYDLINTYSPFYLGVNSGYYCKQHWWYNLLYLQNFLDMRDICCSWTWYLACEMQFYILITALLVFYAKSETLAKISFVTLALGFATIGWLCNFSNGITFDLDVLHSTLDQLYVKPWVRINPYFGGAFCGWLLHQHGQWRRQKCHNYQQQPQQPQQQHHYNHQQKQLLESKSDARQPLQQQKPPQPQQMPQQQQLLHHHPKCQEKCEMSASAMDASKATNDAGVGRWHAAFWLFIGIVYVFANFMSYWRNTPTWLVATIMSFGKLLFALCIGGGILMCAWGHGGRLNSLLSTHLFRLLNKFCFSIYLLTPVITMVAYGLRNEPTNFNEIGSATDFIAVNILAVLCSFIAYVLVELPMQRMSNKLLHKRG